MSVLLGCLAQLVALPRNVGSDSGQYTNPERSVGKHRLLCPSGESDESEVDAE
jgi:hypothetical protein